MDYKDLQARFASNESKAKFWRSNRDVFLKYFDSLAQYESLIAADNFPKMEQIVKTNTNFNLNDFICELHK